MSRTAYYDFDPSADLGCGTCGWAGLGTVEHRVEFISQELRSGQGGSTGAANAGTTPMSLLDIGLKRTRRWPVHEWLRLEVRCPRCGEPLVVSALPGLDEARAAAADGNQRALADLPVLEEQLAPVSLRSPDQLPDLVGGEVKVVLELERHLPHLAIRSEHFQGLAGRGFTRMILRHRGQKIWAETESPTLGADRYERVFGILHQRYAGRFAGLYPDEVAVAAIGWGFAGPELADDLNEMLREDPEGLADRRLRWPIRRRVRSTPWFFTDVTCRRDGVMRLNYLETGDQSNGSFDIEVNGDVLLPHLVEKRFGGTGGAEALLSHCGVKERLSIEATDADVFDPTDDEQGDGWFRLADGTAWVRSGRPEGPITVHRIEPWQELLIDLVDSGTVYEDATAAGAVLKYRASGKECAHYVADQEAKRNERR